MLNEGDQVPDIRMEGLEGKPISPANFKGNKLVIYFYPKDDTSGCTREAQDFTALAADFEEAGTWILGVSKDDAKKHRKFIDKYN
jgi:peroxiredoxin Q/BCP